MAWMVRVMASFGVVEPFEHELGSCAWRKELQLQLGCHRSEELAHCEHAFLGGLQPLTRLLTVLVASIWTAVL